MEAVKEKQRYIALYSDPKDMMIVEQVFVMVWLAQNHTLRQLRQRQEIIQQQIKMAARNHLPEKTFENLDMMDENTAAAIHYQTFPDDGWIRFIKFPD